MKINLYNSITTTPHSVGNFLTRGLYSLGDSLIADSVRNDHKGNRFNLVIKGAHLSCYETPNNENIKQPNIFQKIIAYIGVFLKWLATFSPSIQACHTYVEHSNEDAKNKILQTAQVTLKKEGGDFDSCIACGKCCECCCNFTAEVITSR